MKKRVNAITHRKLVDLVAKRSEVPPQIVDSLINDISEEICVWVAQGRAVTVGRLGTIKPVKKDVKPIGVKVGDLCFRPVRWRLALRPGELLQLALSVLPVAYEKLRAVEGGRLEDVQRKYGRGCGPENGNVGPGVEGG